VIETSPTASLSKSSPVIIAPCRWRCCYAAADFFCVR
jgi:hypothetical protein